MAKQLLPGEILIRTARQHWTIFVPIVAVTVVVMLLGIVILVGAPDSVGSVSVSTVKLVIGLALVVVGLGSFLLRYTRWRYTTFMLTNRRVVVSKGVLSRYMESINLDRIQDVAVRQGLLSRMLRAGDIEIESAGRDGGELLKHLNDPLGFSNLLQDAVDKHRMGIPFVGANAGAQGQGYPQQGQGYPPQGGYAQQGGYPQQTGFPPQGQGPLQGPGSGAPSGPGYTPPGYEAPPSGGNPSGSPYGGRPGGV